MTNAERQHYADPADTPSETAFAQWLGRFEDKLLEHVRSDNKLQAELRRDWEHCSDPGATAAYYLELICYARARMQMEAKLAREFYENAAWQDREEFARANEGEPE